MLVSMLTILFGMWVIKLQTANNECVIMVWEILVAGLDPVCVCVCCCCLLYLYQTAEDTMTVFCSMVQYSQQHNPFLH